MTLLVNDAGVQNPPATIEGTDHATWSRILDVNLTGTFLGEPGGHPPGAGLHPSPGVRPAAAAGSGVVRLAGDDLVEQLAQTRGIGIVQD